MSVIFGLHDARRGGFRLLAARRFKKDAISVGTYVTLDGRELVVTPERLDRWVATFNAQRAAGLRIPFPIDHSNDSRDNQGWVEALARDGNVLDSVVEAPLEEHARLLGTTIREVSVAIDPDYTDGTGRRWGECIRHISPCTNPVVPGQKNFVPLRVEDKDVIYYRRKEGSIMDWKKLIQEALGLSGEPDDAAVAAALKDKIEGHAKNLREIKSQRDQGVAAAHELREKLKTVEAKLKEQGVEEQPRDESPEVKRLRQEVDQLRADKAGANVRALRDSGRITPAMESRLRALLGEREFALRQVVVEGAPAAAGDALLAAFNMLPEGAALDLRERTRLAVERPNPNDQDKPATAAELREAGKGLAALAQPGAAK